jgi:hypothetical protein
LLFSFFIPLSSSPLVQGNINFVKDKNGDGQPDIYSVTISDPTICWDIPGLAQTAVKASSSGELLNLTISGLIHRLSFRFC